MSSVNHPSKPKIGKATLEKQSFVEMKNSKHSQQTNSSPIKAKLEKIESKSQNENEDQNPEELKGVESLKNQPPKATTSLDYGGNAFGFSHVRPEADGFW